MEIKITSKMMLQILHVLSWIIFIGLCIEAGSYLFNAIFSVAINPAASEYFKLSELMQYDTGYFLTQVSLIFIVAVMKAFLFYLIVKMLHDKKLDLSKPFSEELYKFVSNLAYLTLFIGGFSHWGVNYSKWLVKKGIEIPSIENLNLDGADVWLFMGVALLVIAQIFKKGIEIQSENELTI
ncbi:MAG: DUF2975 domain-containing protein [Flavobacterium sp.]|nr:DUF2975 domain-containing protein [Flavobacterium sp.]MBP8157394.1 DUF2975 domain-containing protein [Flavobacterium sp.]